MCNEIHQAHPRQLFTQWHGRDVMTGWPPGLLQDDCRKLSKWLAGKPGARYIARKNIDMTDPKNDPHAELMALADRFATTSPGGLAVTRRDALEAFARTLTDRIAELERIEYAYNEWQEKSEWVQKTARPKELGKHRADVMRERIADLESQLEAVGAGGVSAMVSAPAVAFPEEPNRGWWDCLIEDVSATDCRYRGDPSYDHDAYWMRDHVVKMLKKRRDAAPPAQADQPAPAVVERQYFYRVNDCQSYESNDEKCICWHDEGAGPLANKPNAIQAWRAKPVAEPANPDAIYRNPKEPS